ncbi:MAG TPA: response regulator [Terriglobales bacterium]|nr:response regulator [Terriglobales bacterium]
MSSVRVLVVEDGEPFRRFIASTLQKRPELQIICEVSDGLEAVQKAQELQPDLVMLDIGLPTLSGIEAARRIRKLAPESKILFLSQESSADMVQEALGSGAHGYVVKAHAGSELLPAVKAVLQGDQFVSSGLRDHHFTGVMEAQAPALLCPEEGLISHAPGKGETTHSHKVQFYSDDASFLFGLTHFIESALESGNTAIAIATESHRKNLLQSLQAHGVNITTAIEQGRYIPLDVAETLSTFMVNDLPDPVRFSKVAAGLIVTAATAAKAQHSRVATCGEGTSILWTEGKADAAIQLEHLWDEIARTRDMDILCGYVLTSFQRRRESGVYERICAEHSSVVHSETN